MQNLLRAYTQSTSRRTSDPESEAVRKYAPIVYRIVQQMSERLPRGVERECLFSAGMFGLLDALAKYDDSRGIAFEAYARIRIKGAIIDELRSLDHLTRSMRRRSRSVHDSQEQLAREEGHPVDDGEVAERMGISIEEVQSSKTRHAAPETVDPSTLDSLSMGTLWQEPMSMMENLEHAERVRLVSRAVSQLPERNRLVLGLYYEAELTLLEIGEVLGVTQSRISQILRKTVEMLRESIAAQFS